MTLMDFSRFVTASKMPVCIGEIVFLKFVKFVFTTIFLLLTVHLGDTCTIVQSRKLSGVEIRQVGYVVVVGIFIGVRKLKCIKNRLTQNDAYK